MGPRRSVLQAPINIPDLPGNPGGTLFVPVGRAWFTGDCVDDPEHTGFEGNGNGKCNKLTDKQISDFADLEETDVTRTVVIVVLTAVFFAGIAVLGMVSSGYGFAPY